ncbi:MAG: DUF4377 domain-containing protein [Myxococcales bacterium]|nr:DUF4377 domain-containing protein [Polyangiaceae bacterium]MDW8251836.1 DUF4377 domain-containing protein [Myxococcales bacterium]
MKQAPFLVVSYVFLACSPNPAPSSVTVPPETSGRGAGASSLGPAGFLSTKAASPGVRTIWVREHLVDCEGEAPMKCMQIRESEQGGWRLFYGTIEGFSHEDSYTYELRVQPEDQGSPPMDAPAKRYRLVEVVSKKKVTP